MVVAVTVVSVAVMQDEHPLQLPHEHFVDQAVALLAHQVSHTSVTVAYVVVSVSEVMVDLEVVAVVRVVVAKVAVASVVVANVVVAVNVSVTVVGQSWHCEHQAHAHFVDQSDVCDAHQPKQEGFTKEVILVVSLAEVVLVSDNVVGRHDVQP